MSKYIISDPNIMGGVPIISGTRIPISRIVYLLSEGHTLDSITEIYPHVEKITLAGSISELIHGIDNKRYETATV